tara:strand:+ start:108 stop:1154 length:1047 start_codon:yes stop_codon:yes gene_type:complete
MKVYHITEAGRTEPPLGGLGDRTTNRGPSVSSPATASGPLKGQSIKLNGVSYQFKGNAWVVTDTSEFKGRNPPKKGQLADRNAKELLNQKSAKLNGGGAAPKADAPKADEIKPKADDTKTKAPKAKAGFIKKFTKFIGKGSLVSLVFTVDSMTRHADTYIKRLQQMVDNGEPINIADPELKRIRYNIAEEGVTSMLTLAGMVTAGGLVATKIIRTIGLASATFPGAGWVAAAIAGATWLGVGYLTQLVAGWLSSRVFAQGMVNWMLSKPFTPGHAHSYAINYAKITGKPVPTIVESLEESSNAKVDFASIGKELMDPKLKAALIKAKQKGATGKNAMQVIDKRLDKVT